MPVPGVARLDLRPGVVVVCRPVASSARQAYQNKKIWKLVKHRIANVHAPVGAVCGLDDGFLNGK
jgi:hypothetical protein